MGSKKLRGKDLRAINFHSTKATSLALDIVSKHFKYHSKQQKLALLESVRQHPEQYRDDEVWAVVAHEFLQKDTTPIRQEIPLKEDATEYRVFGRKHIDSNAYQQMELAMRLPISQKGAFKNSKNWLRFLEA